MSRRSKQKKSENAKYFQTQKKGEIFEWRQDLQSNDRSKHKEAVKKVIAAMTVGKDVSSIFPEVINLMQTNDIELKKLIYLYIINYARREADKALLVVNSFHQDAMNDNPLVRALAIRTMGCIRVQQVTEHLSEPLSKGLKDKDPYVRKTSAVCVAKLFDTNPDLVEEHGFLDRLRDLLSDENPMVVANAVAALSEISESSNRGENSRGVFAGLTQCTDVFRINQSLLKKLLAAINECTEWGQVFILDALASYEPTKKEAEMVIERITPRLQHANSAVSMSAIKVIMKYLGYIKNPPLEQELVRSRLPPPLITLLSEHRPEIQFMALRNINLIVQKRPEILAREIKHFFCKYNDPIYVKLEKLEILCRLCSLSNIKDVLLEFREYASEVDVDFVRRSVRSIGRCAIKLERAADQCIKVLLDLIKTKVNYVVQEAIIVIKDVFRKYPNRYENIIGDLCDNLASLDEPEAKASMVWIIGEYASRIENSPELLESFIDNFLDEPAVVQLQLLTAAVKLFLRRPDGAKNMVEKVLRMATEKVDNPDLRDRGYVYWRLLAKDPKAAQEIVLANKPVISDDTFSLDPQLLDTLIAQISTLASVYHKPPEAFVKSGRTMKLRPGSEEEESETEESEESEESEEEEEKTPASSPPPSTDILGGDILGLDVLGAVPVKEAPRVRRDVLLSFKNGKGLEVRGAFRRVNNVLMLDMELENKSNKNLASFAVQFNKNFYGLLPGPLKVSPLSPGQTTTAMLPMETRGTMDTSMRPGLLQVALRTELGVVYFQAMCRPELLFDDEGQLERGDFLNTWQSLGDEKETRMEIPTGKDVDTINTELTKKNVFYIAKRQVPGKATMALYMCVKVRTTDVLLELKCDEGVVRAAAKSNNTVLSKFVLLAIKQLLK